MEKLKEMKVEWKVGDIIKGNLVIARIHEWAKWKDLEVINKKTGKKGTLRITNYAKSPDNWIVRKPMNNLKLKPTGMNGVYTTR
ncbi:MAG TPA: hypothetical protein ENH46_04720 [Candidatus Pacearchaeota archaeon]|nr:hypothetical protein [Candidatus Pacearchaeota archaeon]